MIYMYYYLAFTSQEHHIIKSNQKRTLDFVSSVLISLGLVPQNIGYPPKCLETLYQQDIDSSFCVKHFEFHLAKVGYLRLMAYANLLLEIV